MIDIPVSKQFDALFPTQESMDERVMETLRDIRSKRTTMLGVNPEWDRMRAVEVFYQTKEQNRIDAEDAKKAEERQALEQAEAARLEEESNARKNNKDYQAFSNILAETQKFAEVYRTGEYAWAVSQIDIKNSEMSLEERDALGAKNLQAVMEGKFQRSIDDKNPNPDHGLRDFISEIMFDVTHEKKIAGNRETYEFRDAESQKVWKDLQEKLAKLTQERDAALKQPDVSKHAAAQAAYDQGLADELEKTRLTKLKFDYNQAKTEVAANPENFNAAILEASAETHIKLAQPLANPAYQVAVKTKLGELKDLKASGQIRTEEVTDKLDKGISALETASNYKTAIGQVRGAKQYTADVERGETARAALEQGDLQAYAATLKPSIEAHFNQQIAAAKLQDAKDGKLDGKEAKALLAQQEKIIRTLKDPNSTLLSQMKAVANNIDRSSLDSSKKDELKHEMMLAGAKAAMDPAGDERFSQNFFKGELPNQSPKNRELLASIAPINAADIAQANGLHKDDVYAITLGESGKITIHQKGRDGKAKPSVETYVDPAKLAQNGVALNGLNNDKQVFLNVHVDAGVDEKGLLVHSDRKQTVQVASKGGNSSIENSMRVAMALENVRSADGNMSVERTASSVAMNINNGLDHRNKVYASQEAGPSGRTVASNTTISALASQKERS